MLSIATELMMMVMIDDGKNNRCGQHHDEVNEWSSFVISCTAGTIPTFPTLH